MKRTCWCRECAHERIKAFTKRWLVRPHRKRRVAQKHIVRMLAIADKRNRVAEGCHGRWRELVFCQDMVRHLTNQRCP